MKKFVLTALATLLITGTAFAGSNSGFNVNLASENSSTIDIGACYGTISYVNKNNSGNHTDVSGWGFVFGDYEKFNPFMGVQASAFFIFPKELKQYHSSGYVSNLSDYYNSPVVMSFEAMLMLDFPITFFNIKAGAGIAYTLHYESDSYYYTGSEAINHYFAVPVSISASVTLGSLGIKAGCDFQFVFSNYITQNDITEELTHLSYDTFIILPYVCATIRF